MQKVKRILVVRIGRVGDMVMITPALQALLSRYSQARFTLLTNSDGKRVLKGFSERIDNTIIYNRKSLLPWFTRLRIKKMLNKVKFEHIYCFESKPGFLTLFSNLDATVYNLKSTSDKIINYSQRCLDLVSKGDNMKNSNITSTLPVTEEALYAANKQLESLQITKDDYIVGLHPSFSGLAKSFGRGKKHAHHKVWPIDFWSTLAIKIKDYAKQHQQKIIIMMDLVPDEKSIGQLIHQHSQGAALFQCPPLDFEHYKATLSRYDLLITPDSGPMHIAAAVNTQLIALFSRHDPRECQPFVPDDQFTVIRAEGMSQPEKGLAAIDPHTVFQACLAYLPKSTPKI